MSAPVPPPTRSSVVLPTREDPLVRAGSEVLGGPLGSRIRVGAARFWTPLAVLMLLATGSMLLGVLAKQHCRTAGWTTPDQFFHLCYSDVPLLFGARVLATGAVPYVADVPVEQAVEYPVLTGAVMWLTALLTPGDGYTTERALWYFDVNAVFAAACALGVVAATARTSLRRPWDAALVALSPGLVLTATINWDLWAALLTSLAMLLWSRNRPALAGVMLGLGTAAKFYPLLLLGPLLLLCLRAGRLRAWYAFVTAAVAAWLATNVPVMLADFDGWAWFYRLSSERGAGFSSVWFVLSQQGRGLPDGALNAVALLCFVACCAGIAWLALAAPRRPRVGQLAFLVVAAFLLTNKVYSPQYVLWLIPLAAVARPVWRDVLVWQLGEVVHFVGIWLLLAGYTEEVANRALPADGYGLTVLAHIAGTLWLVGIVVRDVLAPRHDVVRSDGSDDPAGGPLDGAPDAVVLDGARLRRVAAGEAATVGEASVRGGPG